MLPSKAVAIVLSAFAITATVVLAYALQHDHGAQAQAHYGNPSNGLVGSKSPAGKEVDSLAAQVAALRLEVEALTQPRTGVSETTNGLREQIHSLRDQLNDVSGQLYIDRSNPLDSGIEAAAYVQQPDEAEQDYLAQQQLDVAENEFNTQYFDPNWAEATENRLREGLASPEYALPGVELHLESLMENLECRSTSCRLNIKDVNVDNRELLQLQHLASSAGLFSSGSFYQTDTGEIVMFLHTVR